MARASDTKLIQGAGVAYKNWDNDPAMYAGINKVIKKGEEEVEEYRRAYELEKKRNEAIKQQQDQNWNNATEETYAAMGGLSEAEQEYEHKVLQEIKQELVIAQNEKNKEGERKNFGKLNEEIKYIQDTVDLKKSWSGYADKDGVKIPGLQMSAAMDNSGGPGGNNGKQKEILTHWMQNESVVLDNPEEGKKRLYAGTTESGHEYIMTKDEIEAIFIPNDPKYINEYNEVYDKYSVISKFNRTTVQRKISQAIPKEGDISGLRAFMADDNFMGENFASLLDADSNLKSEVDLALQGGIFDTDEVLGISNEEFLAFKEAIVDPYNSFWLNNSGVDESGIPQHDLALWEAYARNIVVERLLNVVENANTLLKDSKKKNNVDENALAIPN